MGGRPGRQRAFGARPVHCVLEADPGAAEAAEPGEDLQDVVVERGAQEARLDLDDRQPQALGFQLAVGAAAAAEKVGAAHLEPGQVLAVPGDPHLVRLRVANADGARAARAQRAASSRRRAAVSGSPAPKTAVPATITSTPACASALTLLSSTPPSTSICGDSPRRPTVSRSRRTLSRLAGRKAWPP